MTTRFSEADLAMLQGTAKRKRNYHRLANPAIVEHEFNGQYGHPSSYAFVRFECSPSDELSFEVAMRWPESIPAGYVQRLECAIAEGVADALLDGLYPHTGCRVALVDIRYDNLGSSEAAFLWSATAAARKLLSEQWTIVIRPRNDA